MLLLAFKRAEFALADGRLDEAWRIVSQPKVRAHRRGQALIARLLEAWVRRGNEHLDHERLDQAMADYRRACGVEPAAAGVASLGQRVHAAVRERDRRKQQRDGLLRHAADRIASGSWSAAHKLLRDAEPELGDGAVRLMRDLDAEVSGFERWLEVTEGAVARGDWSAAVRGLVELEKVRRVDERVLSLRDRLMAGATGVMDRAIEAARLGEAEVVAGVLRPVLGAADRAATVVRALGSLAACRRAVVAGRLDEACDAAGVAASLLPGVGWVMDLKQELEGALAVVRRVAGGPLAGLSGEGDLAQAEAATAAWRDERPVARRVVSERVGEGDGLVGVASVLEVLSIEGVGAYVVCRDERVSFGPVAQGGVDVPLLAEPGVAGVVLRREEESLLVEQGGEAARVLKDGERLSVGRGHRLQVTRPHPASGTGVVELLRGRIAGTDARHVLLMDQQVVIGAGRQAHVRMDRLDPSVVVFVRDGGLWAKESGGAGRGEAQRLDPGATIGAGGLRLRLDRLTA